MQDHLLTRGPTTWTRSTQQVEGTSVIVDVRSGLPGLAIFRSEVGEDLRIRAAQLPRGLEADTAERVRSLLGELLPLRQVTVRLDTTVPIGPHDMADCIARALRHHLAGVNVEQMDDSLLAARRQTVTVPYSEAAMFARIAGMTLEAVEEDRYANGQSIPARERRGCYIVTPSGARVPLLKSEAGWSES